MERAQLFTASGSLVATVNVRMEPSGRWPLVVTFAGRHYALQNGRYVRVAEVFEATEATEVAAAG